MIYKPRDANLICHRCSAYHKGFEDRREIAVPLPGNAATNTLAALRNRTLLSPPLTVGIDTGIEVDTLCLPNRRT